MNLHGQIMNLPAPTDAKITEVVRGGNEIYAYKVGHRDARLAAAELAQEADARIAKLEAQLSAALERAAKAEAERDKAKATMQESIALMRDVY